LEVVLYAHPRGESSIFKNHNTKILLRLMLYHLEYPMLLLKCSKIDF
jgi:hypothetical protein